MRKVGVLMIKFKPYFEDKMWGGDYMKNFYGYDCSNSCGEAWGISALSGMSSTVTNGIYQGKTLRELYEEKPDLFGYLKGDFPILVKVIEAKSDLSIQVHPNDIYAKQHNNTSGKNECWYILDCDEDTEIVVGHNAVSEEELISRIDKNEYAQLLNRFPIQKEDIFDVPSGTIHAICNGTIILEVQQSSNETYRVYDYDRLYNGELRKLHLKQALEVIETPSRDISSTGVNENFVMEVLRLSKKEVCTADRYGDYYFIIDGIGEIDTQVIEQGDFIFMPSLSTYSIEGDIKVVKIRIK